MIECIGKKSLVKYKHLDHTCSLEDTKKASLQVLICTEH